MPRQEIDRSKCLPGDSEALRRAFGALARFSEAAGLDRSDAWGAAPCQPQDILSCQAHLGLAR